MASAWRRRLKGAGGWAVLILAVLFIGGLCFALPIVEALHSRGAAAESWLVFPVLSGGIVLAMAAYIWLKASWSRPELSPFYEIGGHQRRLQQYQSRVSELRVATALLAYYVPAVFVTITQHGSARLEDYFRGHLIDGFGFVGFLAIGWQLVTRDINQAAARLPSPPS